MALISAPHRDSPHRKDDQHQDASNQVIDLEHLGRYTLHDRDLEKEILGLFIDTLVQTTRDLETAATRERWAQAAHTLKGSARAVGAWELADLMERIERAPEFPSDEDARHGVVNDVKAISARTKAFITSLN